MSDIKSQLPVRSVQDPDQRVQTKVVDATNPGSQQLAVDSQGNAQVKVHGNDPSGSDIRIALSEEGRPNGNGEYNGSTNSKPASSAIIAHDRGASPTEADQTIRVTAIENNSVNSMDIALHDSEGAPFSYSNPLPTYPVENPGVELQDYFESATDIASGSNDSHIYTVPADKILKLDQVLASGSGRMRVLIETSQDGTNFTKLCTRFNSTAEPNCDTSLSRIVSIPEGGKVKVTRTNLDENAFSMYSTIIGVLIEV